MFLRVQPDELVGSMQSLLLVYLANLQSMVRLELPFVTANNDIYCEEVIQSKTLQFKLLSPVLKIYSLVFVLSMYSIRATRYILYRKVNAYHFWIPLFSISRQKEKKKKEEKFFKLILFNNQRHEQ